MPLDSTGRALVVANGDAISTPLLQSLSREAGFIVAADGGLHHLRRAGLTADYVTGDLDSLTAGDRESLHPGALRPNADPDATDLQKAVELAIATGASDIVITCTGGGRADHALANLSMLTIFRRRARLRIVDDRFEISLVEGSATLEGPPGTVVSLVALGTCTGITTRGLRWDLTGAILPFSPHGIHNEIRESPASVAVRAGDLLLFNGRWVEKHR